MVRAFSKVFRSIAVLASALTLASASPIESNQKRGICPLSEHTEPPTEPYVVEIGIADNENDATWTALADVGTSLTSVHARAIRSWLGTIDVEYAFNHASSDIITYEWEVYQTNSTSATPSKSQFTQEVETKLNLTGSITDGRYSLCVYDNGAQKLLVSVELE